MKYAPKVKVSVIGGPLGGGPLQEGSEVRLECKSNANPGDVEYRWYINDEAVAGSYKTQMVGIQMYPLVANAIKH